MSAPIRLAIASTIGALLVGWCLGYRQGFEDGKQSLPLWPNETVTVEGWR